MIFEDPTKCPLLEDKETVWENIPYCSFVYGELTAWTLDELCFKNFKDCPVYKKFLDEQKNSNL